MIRNRSGGNGSELDQGILKQLRGWGGGGGGGNGREKGPDLGAMGGWGGVMDSVHKLQYWKRRA